MTRTNPKVLNALNHWRSWLRGGLAGAALVVLSACGGGGGAGGAAPANTSVPISGEMQSNIQVMKPSEISAIQVATILPGNFATLTGDAAMASSYSEGQIVSLPPGTPKFPLGYTGRVVSKTSTAGQTTLQLRPATVPEVFKKLTVDFDTLRDNGQIVGVIAPPGAKTKSSFINLTKKNQTGLNVLSESPLGLSGDISTSYNISDKVKLEISGKISNLRVVKKLKYDPPVLTGAGCTIDGCGSDSSAIADYYKEVNSKVAGDIDVAIKLIGENGAIASVPDNFNIWNTLESNTDLTGFIGLDAKDKKGLLPIAGLIIQPTGLIVPFTGDGGVVILTSQSAAIVVWIYANLSGELTINGDVTLINYKSSLDYDLNLSPSSNNELQASAPRTPNPPSSWKSGFHGSGSIIQNAGVTVAADLLVGGIRPLAVQFTPFVETLDLTVSGGGEWDWGSKTFAGSLCVDRFRISANAKFVARAALGVKVAGWTVVNGSAEYEHKFPLFDILDPAISEKVEGRCLSGGSLDFSLADLGGDPANQQNKVYEIDLSRAFEGVELPRDVKYLSPTEPSVDWILSIVDEATSQRVKFFQGQYKTVSGQFSVPAKVSASLKSGANYVVRLDTSISGFDIWSSNFSRKFVEKKITIPSSPLSADFSVSLIDNDCKRIKVAGSSSGGSSGETVSSWVWAITNDGSVFPPVTTTKSSTDVALAACGSTAIKLTANTSAGRVATAIKTIDTNQLLALPTFTSNVALSQISNGIHISWNSAAGTDISYQLSRSVGGGAPTLTRELTQTFFVDTPLLASGTYYYTVKACNAAGCSAAKTSSLTYAPTVANRAPVVSDFSVPNTSSTTIAGSFSVKDEDNDSITRLRVHVSRTQGGSECSFDVWGDYGSTQPAGPKNFSSASCAGFLATNGTGTYWAKVEAWDARDGKALEQADAVATTFTYTPPVVPSVTSIVPGTATLGVPTSFTVYGKDLPLTAVLLMADASCGPPTDSKTASFTVSCTPNATGVKTLTVMSSASGGTVINVSRTVMVTEAPILVFGTIKISPSVKSVYQAISFWIIDWSSDAIAKVKTVVWNFGAAIAGQAMEVVNGINAAVERVFTTVGEKTVTATYKDADGKVLGRSTMTFTVTQAVVSTTAAITSVKTAGGAEIKSGSTTTETRPVLSGTLSSPLGVYEVLLLYRDAVVMGVGNTSATAWTFTPATALPTGTYRFKAVVARADGVEGTASAVWVIGVVASPVATGRLTDTGITPSQCYQAGSDVLVSCTSAGALSLNDKQDGMLGRDVTAANAGDGKLGFSYRRGGSSGLEECVTVNLSGLTWEGKPTTGLRAAGNTYTNYGDGRAGDASAYVAAVNASALCGYTDWRLPEVDELQSLVDYSNDDLDPIWFPNAQYRYWAGTGYVGNPSFAWSGGGSSNGKNRSDRNYVRLVR